MSARPSAVHLLAGGPRSRGSSSDPLLRQVFEAAGARAPSVAYIGAANGDNGEFFKRIASVMRSSGAGEVRQVRLGTDESGRASVLLEEADVVFLSGGDVGEGMAVLRRAAAVPVLERLFRAGKPFFGLSAGSIMLAREWVRWTDPEDEGSAVTFACLGFAPVLCDTHGEDDGWEELLALLRLEPEGAVGYGIPSGAGLRVAPDGSVAAMGAGVHRFARRGERVERLPDLA